MVDLIIKNAEVIDGSGQKAFTGDVAVKDGKIACIGSLETIEAKECIDAKGLTLTPGFIDIHTHSDFSVFVDNRTESQIRQGVTTELAGLCGSSLAPCNDKNRDSLQILGKYNGTDTWSGFDEYLTVLKKHTMSTNMGFLVGHGTIRLLAMQDSDPTKPATSKEIANMASILEECMQEGAFGLSTGLEYHPGKGAMTLELEKLCKVVAKYNGTHASHVRNRDKYALTGFTEVMDLSRNTGVRLQISHLNPKYGRPDNTVRDTLKMVNSLRDEGVEVGIDCMPTEWNFVNGPAIMPSWFHEKTLEEKLAYLGSAEGRKELKSNDNPIWELATQDKWDEIKLFTSPKNTKYLGETLEDIGKDMGCSGFDALCALMTEEKENMNGLVITGHGFLYEDNAEMLSDPECAVVSDAVPSAVDGPLKNLCVGPNSYIWAHSFLKEYIQEKNIMSYEEGIRHLTSLPAKLAGFADRGKIMPGYRADMVLLDKNAPKTKFDMKNPKVYPSDIQYVFVNGNTVLKNGTRTDLRPGQIIKK